MDFKVALIVVCLLISYSLVEGTKEKNHKYENKHTRLHIGHIPDKKDRSIREYKTPSEDRLKTIKLCKKSSSRAADNEVEESSGGFGFDFDKIPGGAGVKIIYNALTNIFMSVNRILNFGFIWDGISGIVGLFNIQTGAMFVINAVTKMGGFVGYMLQDVTNTVNAITTGVYDIGKSGLDLLQSVVRFALDTAANLTINLLDLVYGLLGVAKRNLKDILGPVYDVVMSAFQPLFDQVKKLTKSVANGIMTILEPVLGAIQFVTSPLVKLLGTVMRVTGGIFNMKLFAAISDGFKLVLVNVVAGVVGGVNQVTGGIFGTLNGVINGVGGIFQTIGGAIGSILPGGNKKVEETTGYSNIKTKTIIDEDPIHFTYANNTEESFQHFIREGRKKADLIIIYKGGTDNFIAFFNRITGAIFIISGNTGSIAIFDTDNGAGIYIKPNSTTGYAIQPPGFLRADFVGPNAKEVSDAITRLARAIDDLNYDLQDTTDTVTLDVVEVLRTLTLKNLISSVLTGEALVVVSRLLGNLLGNLANALVPMIRPALGVANTLVPFLLNLPNNLINGLISLIGSVVKRFLGLFTPEFVAELAKTVVIAALKGLTTPMLAPLLTPLGGISLSVNTALLGINSAVDFLKIP